MNSLIFSALLIGTALATSIDCVYQAQKGISFDLSPLRNDVNDYSIRDSSQSQVNLTYVFNICRDVIAIPKAGGDGVSCKKTVHDMKGELPEYEERLTPSFLVSQDEDSCRRMAAPLADSKYNFLDYDVNDKAAGISLQYNEGDYLFAGWMYYGTRLSIRCSNRPSIPTEADVSRYGISIYVIWLDSVYACPRECSPDAKGSLCSGHGICMYDDSVYQTRCYCNNGLKGDKCDKSVGLSMTTIFTILDIAAVVIVLGTIMYFGCKLRKIRLDPEANVSLDTKFNELGSLAYTK